ncbi:MAG: glucuronate isomerase, partial [Clostridiales bacterium]|nr:glucuronate isomerase [Clostridiales bacterium]
FFIGNPIYHWVHMELGRYFGIKVPLSGTSANQVWEEANAGIREGDFTACSLITAAKVEFAATTDDPSSNLEWHERIAGLEDFKTSVVPTWRPDKVLDITSVDYVAYLEGLAYTENMNISSLDELLELLIKRMDFFEARGCCIADHALTGIPSVSATYNEAKAIFTKKIAGVGIGEEEAEKFKFYMLYYFGCEYSGRNWAMQLHLSTIRNQNTRLFKLLGPDSGLDSCGEPVNISDLRSLFDRIEMDCGMPKTILYTMNPAAYYPLATLASSFTGSIPGKIQLGAAWWMMDHRDGITEQLKIFANTGGLGLHVGMLTDSRSLLSYVRHDYYRRILCSLIGEWVHDGEVPDDDELLETLIKGVCLNNARRYFTTGR